MSLYEKILQSFSSNKVEYLIVGGFAVNLYGIDRTTKDLDLWINTSDVNLIKLKESFIQLEYSKDGVDEAINRLKNKEVIMIPDDEDLLRIDIISMFSGFLSFDECYARSVKRDIGDIPIRVINLNDLITAKRNTGREQDLLDAKMLEQLRNNSDKGHKE